jgi:hypothetical protein
LIAHSQLAKKNREWRSAVCEKFRRDAAANLKEGEELNDFVLPKGRRGDYNRPFGTYFVSIVAYDVVYVGRARNIVEDSCKWKFGVEFP